MSDEAVREFGELVRSHCARAVVEAMREPTEAMTRAFLDGPADYDGDATRDWQAMIDAILAEKPSTGTAADAAGAGSETVAPAALGEGVSIIQYGGDNPRVVVSADRVRKWLRSIADEAGFADRESCAVQLNVTHPFAEGVTYHLECPSLLIMVSNIPQSRAR